MKLILMLVGAFGTAMSSLVGRVLIALGITFATYTGFETVGTYALTQIKSNFSGMPVDALNLMGYLWVDKAISLIFSAYAAALAIKTAGNTSITRMIRK